MGLAILGFLTCYQIHPEVREFVILAETPRTSFKDINDALMLPKVVASSCLGVNQ